MISSHVQLLCVKKRPLVAAKYPMKVVKHFRHNQDQSSKLIHFCYIQKKRVFLTSILIMGLLFCYFNFEMGKISGNRSGVYKYALFEII